MLFTFLIIWQPLQADEVEDIMRSIKGGDLFEMVNVLTAPEMEGRLSGHKGYDEAAKWVAAQYKNWGLKPVYGKSFLQLFELSYNEMRETTFSLLLPPKNKGEQPRIPEMKIYKDFGPTLYSGFGEVEAEVVFVGFGLTAPELGWDDYRGLDVTGQIVATLRGTPRVEGKDFSGYAERKVKLINAKKHGAVGMILISSAVVSGSGIYIEGLPMVMVGNEVAKQLFSPKGYDMDSLRALLSDGHPISFSTGVKARIKHVGAHHPQSATYNVVGMIEGSDPVLKEEYMIFGGHLDHLGPWPVIHPGANDNASGSVVVMGLAQAFSKLKKRPKRSIVFALFAAEEVGLMGSTHMAENLPTFPSRPIMMSNHDVNGNGTSLYISGGKDYPELFEILLEVNKKFKINQSVDAGDIRAMGAGSDYAPFVDKGIPTYSTWVRGGGRRGITHTAGDSIYVITPKIMEDIVRLYFAAGYQFLNKE